MGNIKEANWQQKIFVKRFSGAKMDYIKDYIKPRLKTNPNHFILYIGTNDLNTEQNVEYIPNKVIDLGIRSKLKMTIFPAL